MKKTFKKILAPLTAAAMMSMVLSGCSGSASDSGTGSGSGTTQAAQAEAGNSGSSQNKPVVKVGVMCPMSGTSARFGELYQASINAAMKAVNEDGLLKDLHWSLSMWTTREPQTELPRRRLTFWISTAPTYPSDIC